jgi:cellulose synthase (UDP-forming)
LSRGQRTIYWIVSSVSLCFVAVLGFWWFQLSHIPHNFSGWPHFFDVVLFIVLSYIIWHPIIMQMFSWVVAGRIKAFRRYHPQPGLKVAFVTTFVPASESIDMLRKTLSAMVSANYKHDTWLLDEGNSTEAKKLCVELGVKHFSRSGKTRYNTTNGKFTERTKAGNHNAWYDTCGNGYDFVAQIDSDFVVSQHFLTYTLGYFHDPKVAFVGTPQIYGNTDKSMIARGAAEQTYSFYGPILRGFYGMETTLLIGANHIIRVAALNDVDHYSAHVTEDLLTGMKLHSRGWKSVYVHEALAIGEGPDTWSAYFNQQTQLLISNATARITS